MFVVLFAAALCALGVGATSAMAAGEDTWVPPKWSASSGSTTFVSGPLTITCTKNTAGGNTIGQGPDEGALPMSPPKFQSCTDSFGGTDTVKSASKGWTVSFVSDSADAGCPSGTGSDESGGSDCVVLGVPQNAAVITVGSLGCTVTVQPGGPTTVGATVNDPGGKTKTSFVISNAPLIASGCGATNQASTFTATYTLMQPNSGILVDTP